MKIGIIFDLDGTLIDTTEFHAYTFKKALDCLKIKNSEELYEKFKTQIGKTLPEIIDTILPDLDEEKKKKIENLKWKFTLEEIDKIKPIQKSIKALKVFSKYPIGLFTSSTKKFSSKVLERLNIEKYFDVIVAKEDVTKGKPNPEGLTKTCEILNCDKCIYVGDSVYDELAAKRAKFIFVDVKSKNLIGSIGKAILESKILLVYNKIKKKVKMRIKEFENVKGKKALFKELSFCLLTANYDAEKSIKIQKKIGNGFLDYDKRKLYKTLKEMGHRYPKTRTDYIILARKFVDEIPKIVKLKPIEAREWLVKNIKGIGYKEASHFLRNVGKKDLAIIDFHIVDVLVRHNIIKRPKTLTRKKYLEIEKILKDIANDVNLNLAELDLVLWYMETGKILK